ncbi:MAG: helix-turn-helix domain-containing protein [Thermoanaerobaculia bacterium]
MKCDVMNESCPSRAVLDRIADKWTALVVGALNDGTMRYGELQRRVSGISQKMLTQTLRGLEIDGLVTRVVYPVVPPMVEYSLTPLGRSLEEPLGAIRGWAEKHLPKLLENRRRAEAGAGGSGRVTEQTLRKDRIARTDRTARTAKRA